jgi:hypothetical protein
MRILFGVAVTAAACLAFASGQASAGIIMYGGLGGHGDGTSMDDGSLVIIDQNTAATTVVGHPAGVARLTGIAFDLNGDLFGSTLVGLPVPIVFPPPPTPGFSDLIEINPANGALITDRGHIRDASGTDLAIADLALQPGTGVLYGISGPLAGGPPASGKLYTISTTTGVATLVGNTGHSFGSIAFAPNGTLYMSAADFAGHGPLNPALLTLDPTSGGTMTSIHTADFLGALGIRPTDGVIFGGSGDTGQIFTIDPVSGAETLVGNTGLRFAGDLDFRATPVPEPVTLGLVGAGLALGLRWRAKRRLN